MSSSDIWRLAWGLVTMLVILVLASSVRRTVAIGVLLVMIPFQFFETRYASSSVLAAYALAAVLLFNGGLKLRMLPALGLILLSYLVSLSQAGQDLLVMQLVTIVQLVSCFLVFVLAYNFARLVETERRVIDLLLAVNVLTVVYCALQLAVGAGEAFVPFGIDAFAFNSNRDPSDPRLVGPFDNPGTTAGYFTLMALVCALELMFARDRRRMFVQILAGLNLLGLVSTGNRASFLILVASFPALLFAFRRQLGAKKVTQYAVAGMATLVIASAVAVAYTGFGHIFERLGSVTETKDGLPTTRAGTWSVAIEKIKEDPWLGEGPYFLSREMAEDLGQVRAEFEDLGEVRTAYDPYPHSLYLYLLRTVGIVGLAALLWFFVQTWRVLFSALRQNSLDDYPAAIVRLGLVLIPAFLGTQITLEFNRPGTMDYAQFIFALMGLLVGTSDRAPAALAGSVPGSEESGNRTQRGSRVPVVT